MRRAIAGVIVAGSVAIGLRATTRTGRVKHSSWRLPDLATPSRLGGPCRAVCLRVGRLIHRLHQARLTATERATNASEVPPADLSLGFHGTRQSANTRRKSGCIS